MPNFVQTPTYLPNTAPTYPDEVSWGASSPFAQKNWLNASQGPGWYGDNPWYNVDSLKNPNVQLDLARAYVISSFWNQFAPSVMAINGAERLEWSEIFAMEPNQDPLGLRQIWLQSNYTDTRKMSVGFNKYGDKVAIHDYDRMIQAKRLDGTSDLWAIAKTLLGESITTFLDYHVRNAYLESVNNRYMGVNWKTGATHPLRGGGGFNTILDTDPTNSYFDIQVIPDVLLALSQRSRGITSPNLVAATTPGVIHSLANSLNSGTVAASTGPISAWREAILYANAASLMNYEVGMAYNTRFASSHVNILYNCGKIVTQGTTTLADYRPGDGAWDGKVDGQWEVGQTNSNTYHWIEAGGATLQASGAYNPAAINVGDIVTIHQRRMPASGPASTYKGVPNGVDYRDGTISNRRVVAIGTITDANHPAVTTPGIAFDVPLMKDYPIGTYITKAVDIHPVIFMSAPATVMAVGDPISAFERPSIDDLDEIRRYAWKGYFQAHLIKPEFVEVVFCAAPKSVATTEVRP